LWRPRLSAPQLKRDPLGGNVNQGRRFCTCGAALDATTESCPGCGRKHYVLKAEPAAIAMTGHAPAIIIDGKDPQTGDVRIRVSSPGATSDARVTPAGEISLEVDGAEAGKKSEAWAIKTLRQALKEQGVTVSTGTATDERGEDAVFLVGNVEYVVQVATTPSVQDFWRAASISSARTEVELQRGIQWLRQTVENKANSIPLAQRSETILAIDARHAGVLSDQLVAASYCSQFGSPAHEYGFASAWIVGPTPKYCVRLGEGRP
jgi:hypothetical protein